MDARVRIAQAVDLDDADDALLAIFALVVLGDFGSRRLDPAFGEVHGDGHGGSLRNDVVAPLLDPGDLVQRRSARKLDIARLRSWREGPGESVELEVGIDHAGK